LAGENKDDQDLPKVIKLADEGLASTAFFIDELELAAGNVKANEVFSLPHPESAGRMVMRCASLSLYPDVAFATDVEILAFDAAAKPVFSVTTAFAKLLSFTVEEKNRTVLIMRAIDRLDEGRVWEPVWERFDGSAPAGGYQIVLDISFEDFVLAGQTSHEQDNLYLKDRYDGAVRLARYVVVPQIFQADVLQEISFPIALLPFSVLAVFLGWRYRTLRRVRYAFFPMLFILPVVFYYLINFFMYFMNMICIWAVLGAGFMPAVIILTAVSLVAFAIIVLLIAYQRVQ
jgi:hypothetical protein